MKKWILAYVPFILIVIIFSSFLVYGHPGRTDSNGGHYDYSSYEYHYHHGYPAHHHPDGICPYGYMSESGNDMSNDEAAEQGRKAGEELLQKIQREREADGNSYIPWKPGAPFNSPEASSPTISDDETSVNSVSGESASLDEEATTSSDSSSLKREYFSPALIITALVSFVFVVSIRRRERTLKLQIELEKIKLEQMRCSQNSQCICSNTDRNQADDNKK